MAGVLRSVAGTVQAVEELAGSAIAPSGAQYPDAPLSIPISRTVEVVEELVEGSICSRTGTVVADLYPMRDGERGDTLRL